jgi:hypothetical protein
MSTFKNRGQFVRFLTKDRPVWSKIDKDLGLPKIVEKLTKEADALISSGSKWEDIVIGWHDLPYKFEREYFVKSLHSATK